MVLHGTARLPLNSDYRVFDVRNSGIGGMTERERDERDLNILTAYENGATKASLVRSYRVTLHYINKLIKEALT